ncbi:hypothetical protein LVD15_07750 [Fulvivirga maritima]|uniref:hypothetical protein n=1 Tax=Fulvivirga maritima TaxID=2904247 RepID=UPI001F23CC30|nr:hypothetical protein [Fulvivirga maritima]UII28311.1 hypothetical protein LVD15_07750 [Fulvivirga maritima]
MEAENNMSKLLANILKAKGLTEEHITALEESGVHSKDDFSMIGDYQTLMDVTGIDQEVSQKVMSWALGATTYAPAAPNPNTNNGNGSGSSAPIIVESADVVKCVHCGAKQPKDYETGDLCISCGLQAEPVLSCHWCYSSGPGKFCRECGSEFLGASDYEIGLFLKKEGESKNAIVKLVKEMTAQEKEAIWAKIRKSR